MHRSPRIFRIVINQRSISQERAISASHTQKFSFLFFFLHFSILYTLNAITLRNISAWILYYLYIARSMIDPEVVLSTVY